MMIDDFPTPDETWSPQGREAYTAVLNIVEQQQAQIIQLQKTVKVLMERLNQIHKTLTSLPHPIRIEIIRKGRKVLERERGKGKGKSVRQSEKIQKTKPSLIPCYRM